MTTNPSDPFRERTLWDVLGDMLRKPNQTLLLFFREIALQEEVVAEAVESPVGTAYMPSEPEPAETTEAAVGTAYMPSEPETQPPLHVEEFPKADLSPAALLVAQIGAIFFASIGGVLLWNAALDNRGEPAGFMNGAPVFFCFAGLIYVAAALAASYTWWQPRFYPTQNPLPVNEEGEQSNEIPVGTGYIPSDDTSPVGTGLFLSVNKMESDPTPHPLPVNEDGALSVPTENAAPLSQQALEWVLGNFPRLLFLPVGIALALVAHSENVVYDPSSVKVIDVAFTPVGSWSWIMAIVVWLFILGVDTSWVYRRWWGGRGASAYAPTKTGIPTQKGVYVDTPLLWFRRLLNWRPGWQHIALLLIMLLASYLRLHDLGGVPPEMTSDHIEKLLDAVRVHEGYNGIFFRNNGGREGFQMHYIAFLVSVTGIEFSFNALKLATVTEGLLNVFLGYWLGVVIMERDRRMGIWLGLSFAALLAISSWHLMLSRLGLRIILTPLSTVVLLIFLARAMRHNRRFDFLMVGVLLGAGMYFYQANRMLPLVVITGSIMAAGVNARGWRDGLRYALNLAAAGIIALVIFLPMYRFGQEFPDDYWNRTRGRIFGEDAFIRPNAVTGVMETYEPTSTEQLDRFFKDWDKFEDNYKNALRMWSWKGDGAWISNGENRPALDPLTDGLFILGVLAWLLLILRKWDVVHILIPISVLIMLLPTAMTLAYPIENPSFTRASGTIPFIFLMAAYPLAQLGYYAQQTLAKNKLAGISLGLMLVTPMILVAAPINYNNFFHTYRDSYARSWKPYEAYAAPLRDFAEGEGSYGNAYIISYPHWLDHRILGTVAGDIKWNNGLVNRTDLFGFIGINDGTPYEYDPTKPLFFMYNQADAETRAWVEILFPGGEERMVLIPDRSDLNFYTYIAPPDIDWAAVIQRNSELYPPQ